METHVIFYVNDCVKSILIKPAIFVDYQIKEDLRHYTLFCTFISIKTLIAWLRKL
ncbi:hypothetical protein BH11BAC3_BH11BAC3_36000 [soil metagenome]